MMEGHLTRPFDDNRDSLEQLGCLQPQAITTQSDCDHWWRGGGQDESGGCDCEMSANADCQMNSNCSNCQVSRIKCQVSLEQDLKT